MSTIKLSHSAKGGLLVFSGSVIISFGPLLIANIETGATASAFYRMLFGGLALLLFSLIRRQSLRPSAAALLFALLAGAAFSGDLFFWHRSIRLVGPGLSTILANFQVFILAVAGIIFFGERPSIRLFISIILGLFGLTLLLELDLTGLPFVAVFTDSANDIAALSVKAATGTVAPPEITGKMSAELMSQLPAGWADGLSAGVIYGLITACFLSVYILALRQSRRVAVPLRLAPNMAWLSFAAAFFLAIALKAEGGSFVLPSVTDAAGLALYGIGCQAIGWLMVSAGLPSLSPGRGGLLLMAEPLFAFIWEIIFMQRPTGATAYIGAGVTILAIYLCLSGGHAKKNQ